VDLPTGQVRFVNSSITHWLQSLHLVGTWYSTSTAIRTWDEDGSRRPVVHRVGHNAATTERVLIQTLPAAPAPVAVLKRWRPDHR
jgi:hypothetical protein